MHGVIASGRRLLATRPQSAGHRQREKKPPKFSTSSHRDVRRVLCYAASGASDAFVPGALSEMASSSLSTNSPANIGG